MYKLTIIYRTCDSVDMLHTTQSEIAHEGNVRSARFYDIPKPLLIRKCLLSVSDAVKHLDVGFGPSEIASEFICVHDSCSDSTLAFVKEMFPEAKIVPCDGSGNGDSFATCVDIACGMADDSTMVLFLEDDYTFLSGDGLFKAVGMLANASARKGIPCAMFLDDYPDRYGECGERCGTDVMVTPFGHMMRIDSSTCSFMTYVGAVKAHRDILMKFKDYPSVMEGQSVDLVWKDVPLYCPLPAITLHCQLRAHVPQYLNADAIKKIMES